MPECVEWMGGLPLMVQTPPGTCEAGEAQRQPEVPRPGERERGGNDFQ